MVGQVAVASHECQPAGILWSWGIAALGPALRGSRGSFAVRLMFSVGVYVRQLF
jgi:hypothetical protein